MGRPHGCYCHQSGAGSATKKKKKEKKRSTYKIPQVVYTIVMGYIFNGTYSAKGSFVKELNIYLWKRKKRISFFSQTICIWISLPICQIFIFFLKGISTLDIFKKLKILLSFLTEGGWFATEGWRGRKRKLNLKS